MEVLGKQNLFAGLQDRLFFFSLFVRRATWVMVSDLYLIQQRREMEKVTATEWHKLKSSGQWISQTSRTIRPARASCTDVKHPSIEFVNLYFHTALAQHTHCLMHLFHHTSWELGLQNWRNLKTFVWCKLGKKLFVVGETQLEFGNCSFASHLCNNCSWMLFKNVLFYSVHD